MKWVVIRFWTLFLKSLWVVSLIQARTLCPAFKWLPQAQSSCYWNIFVNFLFHLASQKMKSPPLRIVHLFCNFWPNLLSEMKNTLPSWVQVVVWDGDNLGNVCFTDSTPSYSHLRAASKAVFFTVENGV